jgi:hypothetical protein
VADDVRQAAVAEVEPVPPPEGKLGKAVKEGVDPYYVAAKARLEFEEKVNAEIAKYSMKFYDDEAHRMLDAEKAAETVRDGTLDSITKDKLAEQKLYLETAKAELDIIKLNAQKQQEVDEIYLKWKTAQTKKTLEELADLEKEAESKRDLDLSMAEQQLADLEKSFGSVFDSIGSAITTSFNGVIAGTQTVSDAFRNMAQSILLSITDTIIKMGLEQLKKSLLELILKYLPAIASVFGGGTSGSPGTEDLSIPSSTPAMAGGGIVTRPTFALVGEGGESEAIVPLSKAGEFGFGGRGSTVYVDARNSQRGVSAEVMQAIRKGMGQAVKVSLSRVNDERRRGGMRGLDR